MLKNTATTYGSVTKVFHWLLFVMLVFSVVAGNFLAAMPTGAEKMEAAGMHKSFGAIILMLVFLRLAWRMINVKPDEESGTPVMQSVMANAMHWLLYALMIAQPVSGIIMSQAAGYPVSFFGLFDFPVLLEKDAALAEGARDAHGTIWIVLAVAFVAHAGAAMYHHLILKDAVLKRMMFGSGK